jgi:hypothetical protein
MHTYRRSDGLYTVGYWLNDDGGTEWHPLQDFAEEYRAAAYACFLNGGADATPMGAARHIGLLRPVEIAENEEA